MVAIRQESLARDAHGSRQLPSPARTAEETSASAVAADAAAELEAEEREFLLEEEFLKNWHSLRPDLLLYPLRAVRWRQQVGRA